MKLLDDEGHEVTELGQAGEIAIKGPQVMAGYWQRPDETARSMTADGFLNRETLAFEMRMVFLKSSIARKT